MDRDTWVNQLYAPSMMMVTSAFGFAGPLYTVPVCFMSIVHTPSAPDAFLTFSWKMPFVCMQH